MRMEMLISACLVVSFFNLLVTCLLMFKKPQITKVVKEMVKEVEPSKRKEKLTEHQINCLRELRSLGVSIALLEKTFGISSYLVYKFTKD